MTGIVLTEIGLAITAAGALLKAAWHMASMDAKLTQSLTTQGDHETRIRALETAPREEAHHPKGVRSHAI